MLDLDRSRPWALHLLRTALIISLNSTFFLLSTTITVFALLSQKIGLIRSPKPHTGLRNAVIRIYDGIMNGNTQGSPEVPRILVTGVGMSKGLFIARTMYLGGCEVVGADFDNQHGNLYCGRFSSALRKFYILKSPAIEGTDTYISQVLDIVHKEKINLWISCSGVATAIEDARLAQVLQKSTNCRVCQFDEEVVRTLDDKLQFMQKTDELGLENLEWYALSGVEDVAHVIRGLAEGDEGKDMKFMIKSASMDDATRGSLPLLSSGKLKEAKEILTSLDYSNGRKWIVQEYIDSGEEYCTHALVIDGVVRAFTACPSASILMHYQQLDPESLLYKKMLEFTSDYAEGLGSVTGHMSFDFLLRYEETKSGYIASLAPIECNPRCHTATVLFEGLEVDLATRYLEILNGACEGGVLQNHSRAEIGFYWMAHDVVMLASSFFDLFVAHTRLARAGAIRSMLESANHLLFWRDPTFRWWDPLPWFALNHLYWPWELVLAVWHVSRWKALNVSTTKMFKM